MHMCTYIYIYMHVYVCMYIYIYVRVCVCVLICIVLIHTALLEAMIVGVPAPLGAGHLRAACLCSLGQPEDAWEAQRAEGLGF